MSARTAPGGARAGGAEGARARAAAERARSQLRRGSERAGRAGARFSRGLGEPALFAILLSSVVSGLFMVLGVVAGDALGLTPARVPRVRPVLRVHDRDLRRGQLAAPRARRRLDVRALRLRRAVELHRRLGDPARLPDRDGDRRRRDLRLPRGVLDRARRGRGRDRDRRPGARLRRRSERARARGRPARHGAAPVAARDPAAARRCRRSRSRRTGIPGSITDSRRPRRLAGMGSAAVRDRGGGRRAGRGRGRVGAGRRGARGAQGAAPRGRADRGDRADPVRVRVDRGADDAAGRRRRDAARRALRRGAGARRGLRSSTPTGSTTRHAPPSGRSAPRCCSWR